MKPQPVRFIHISDTHIGPEKNFLFYTINPYHSFEKLVSEIQTLSFTPDFIVHTGDVAVRMGGEKEYVLYQHLASKIHVPLYYCVGNHDRAGEMRDYLKMGKKEELDDISNKLSYRFDVQGIRFLALDARGPDTIDPHGFLSDSQLKTVKNEVEKGNRPFIVFIHYPPLTLDCPWLDKDMLIVNGDKLHALLVKAKERVRGVFFGHVHRGMQVYKDGILYSSVGSSVFQFQSKPDEKEVVFESAGRAYFNLVTVFPDKTIVKEYSVSNGMEQFVNSKTELKKLSR